MEYHDILSLLTAVTELLAAIMELLAALRRGKR